MRKEMLFSLLAVAAMLAAGQARSAESTGAHACVKDYRQFCKSGQASGGRGLACLKEHVAELSTPCKNQLETLEACAPEIKKICGDGTGDLRTCLKEHARELSAACRGGGAAQQATGG